MKNKGTEESMEHTTNGGEKSIFTYLCFPEKNFERKLLTVGISVTWGMWYCRENWADKEWRKEVFK